MKCQKENCQNPVFGKKLCLYHYKKEFPKKFQIKRKPMKIGGSTNKIKKTSDKQKNRLKKYYKLREIYLKEHSFCEFPECNSKEIEIHHKKGRTGENLFKHFMSVCRYHHMYIHECGQEAYEKEWLIKKH